MKSIARVHYTSDFRKAYKKLPRSVQDAVDRKDIFFRQDPFYRGLRTHKLHGPLDGLWSFWITRDFRVLFEFIKGGAIFYDVGMHDVYR